MSLIGTTNTATAAQAETLSRIAGFALASGATLVVADGAANLLLPANAAGVALATSVSLTGTNSVSAANADLLVGLKGFALASGATLVVADSAANLLDSANAAGLAKATSVSLTGTNTETAAQAEALSTLKGFALASGATLVVADGAANLLLAANAAGLAKATSVSLTGTNTETAAQAEALSKLKGFAVAPGATLAVSDSAANLLLAANAAGVALATSVSLTGTTNTATAAQAEALAKLAGFALASGATLVVADSATNLLCPPTRRASRSPRACR